jgi:hypothetical protein
VTKVSLKALPDDSIRASEAQAQSLRSASLREQKGNWQLTPNTWRNALAKSISFI